MAGALAAALCPGQAQAGSHGKQVLDRRAVDQDASHAGVAQGPVSTMLDEAPLAPISPFPPEVGIWGRQREPAPGPARVHGRTTSGCIAGAVALPARGVGFVRRRPWRPTGFGHPDLIAYVRDLGEAARHAGLGVLLIGDLSLPRGGAYLHGHASHQTGLDVDIAYKTLAYPARAGWRLASASAAAPARGLRRLEALLRLAAADERVDRIFIGARIKHLLCRRARGDRSFLDVLRPWLGHETHFHVRLRCPADSPDCRPNEPAVSIPDDCQALSSWWTLSKNVPAAFADWRKTERASYSRDLPDACRALAEPPASRVATTRPALPARRIWEIRERRWPARAAGARQ
ncbi:MAG: penicillin-insensitive murein endopeptidase [Deltaproteobacteria bacterium]|nr:penicillin-insensitive murein endopeptidase [Deltaproteobacteria bacterium]